MKRNIILTLCLLFVFALVGAAFITAAAAATKQLAKPVLVSPAPEAVFQNVPRTVTVAWSMDPNAASYKVDLYYSSSGPPNISGTPVATESTTNPATAYTFAPSSTVLAANGYYAWTVQAIGTGNFTDSPIASRTFTISSLVTLKTPEPISPNSTTVLVNNPRITTLAWTAIPGATGYTVKVQVMLPANFGNWALDTTDFGSTGTATVTGSQVSSLTHTLTISTPATATNFALPISYRWQVKANGDGKTTNSSLYSTWSEFFYESAETVTAK